MAVGAVTETVEVSGAAPILLGPPARDISVPNTFGTITNTISSPRVIELALEFYF